MHQSPINLRDAVDADLSPIEFHYAVAGRDEINNGHTIQIDYEPGSWVTLEGNDYELKQFHFHTPSENHMTNPTLLRGRGLAGHEAAVDRIKRADRTLCAGHAPSE